jgi:integral membrane sensor domain MASE1
MAAVSRQFQTKLKILMLPIAVIVLATVAFVVNAVFQTFQRLATQQSQCHSDSGT